MTDRRTDSTALIANGSFIHDFFVAPSPCLAIGFARDGERKHVLFALRLKVDIPTNLFSADVEIDFDLFGTPPDQAVKIGIKFAGESSTYFTLVPPNNALIRTALTTIMDDRETIYLALVSGGHIVNRTAGTQGVRWRELSWNRQRILESTVTPHQYQQMVNEFRDRLVPPDQLARWVCRDAAVYEDLSLKTVELRDWEDPREGRW